IHISEEKIRKSRPGKLPIRSATKIYNGQPQPVRVFIPVLPQNIHSGDDHMPALHDADSVRNAPCPAVDGIEVLPVSRHSADVVPAASAEALDRAGSVRLINRDELRIADRLTVHFQTAIAVVE